jgi:hypothetical protein
MSSVSFTWRPFLSRPDMGEMYMKDYVLTKTVHNNMPVMRTQDGELVVILADYGYEPCGWSCYHKDKEMQQYLSTNAKLVRIIANAYISGSINFIELFTTIEKNMPDFKLHYEARHDAEYNGLKLAFIPSGVKYKIRQGECIDILNEEDYLNS